VSLYIIQHTYSSIWRAGPTLVLRRNGIGPDVSLPELRWQLWLIQLASVFKAAQPQALHHHVAARIREAVVASTRLSTQLRHRPCSRGIVDLLRQAHVHVGMVGLEAGRRSCLPALGSLLQYSLK
jgi:hypothetical protein